VVQESERSGFEMKRDEFIAEVKNLAELGSNEEAKQATRATLETLKVRLAGNEPPNLAAQLPPKVAFYVEEDGAERPSPSRSSTSG
jgi:uncharacterized protein (DUF2267 family)